MDIGGFLEVRWQGRETNHSPQFNTEVKNDGVVPPYPIRLLDIIAAIENTAMMINVEYLKLYIIFPISTPFLRLKL
jgi:hypothetical protein